MWPKRLMPKTDLGTIILHWLLVGALLGAIATGLRIASEASDSDWIAALDGLQPRSWIGHLWSALVLIVVAVIYPIYMWRAALMPRIRLDRVRLDAMRLRGVAHSRYRWAAVNIVLNWACYLAVLIAILTGGLLCFDHGGAVVIELHWLATWTILAIAPVHVLAHFAFGGLAQLLRLFRPAQLAPPPPRSNTQVRGGGQKHLLVSQAHAGSEPPCGCQPCLRSEDRSRSP